MNEFFTWEVLATFAGASVATAVITQFVKKSIAKIATQLISYIISLVVLVLATAITGVAEDWTNWVIIPLNAVLVSVAANGEFGIVKRIKRDKE